MKKIVLSTLALVFASTAANAKVIYEGNGTELDLYGRIGAMVAKDENTRADIFNDESKLGLKVKQTLTDGGLSAIGALEMRFQDNEKGSFSKPDVHNGYVGVHQTGVGALTIGTQDTVADMLPVSKYAYHNNNVSQLREHAERSVKFISDDFGGVRFGVDYTFRGSNAKDVKIKDRAIGAGLMYAGDFGQGVGVKFNAGYNFDQEQGSHGMYTMTKAKTNAFLTGAELKVSEFRLGVDYSRAVTKHYNPEDNKSIQDAKEKTDAFQVGVKYNPTEDLGLYTTYQFVRESTDDDTADVVRKNQWTVGVDKKLAENFTVYGEVIGVKYKVADVKSSTEVGGAVGMRLEW